MTEPDIFIVYVMFFLCVVGYFWAYNYNKYTYFLNHKILKDDYRQIFPIYTYLKQKLTQLDSTSLYGIPVLLQFDEAIRKFKKSGDTSELFNALYLAKEHYKTHRSRMPILIDEARFLKCNFDINQQMPTEFKGEKSDTVYFLDHKTTSCSCHNLPNYLKDMLPENSLYFFCRHFVGQYQEATDGRFLKDVRNTSIDVAMVLEQPYRHHFYSIMDEENSDEERPIRLVFGMSVDNPWIDIFIPSHPEYDGRFGYNVFEKRWSHGASPRGISPRVKAMMSARLSFKIR